MINAFFFTFGVGKPYGKFFVEIHAESMTEAMNVMRDCHGDKYAFSYDEQRFEGQASFHGLTRLALIRPFPDGHHRAIMEKTNG